MLCTQSSNENMPQNFEAIPSNEMSAESGGNTDIGFRNQKSFRFLGIRFANPPDRFEYAVPYSGKGETLQATAYGPQCIQPGSGGSEDCLNLNMQTPYVPKASSTKQLRPVHFWIYGGGFSGGTASSGGTDGAQLASREDIVTVSVNYRLSTMGFLVVPGTDYAGNYGIADQNLALRVSCLPLHNDNDNDDNNPCPMKPAKADKV